MTSALLLAIVTATATAAVTTEAEVTMPAAALQVATTESNSTATMNSNYCIDDAVAKLNTTGGIESTRVTMSTTISVTRWSSC
jgi:hypothetical protein